jgi:hypothetical protein
MVGVKNILLEVSSNHSVILKVFSLFSGIGGFELGIIQAF